VISYRSFGKGEELFNAQILSKPLRYQ